MSIPTCACKLLLPLLLLLAACGESESVPDQQRSAPAPPPRPVITAATHDPIRAVPEAFRGHWALTEEDCAQGSGEPLGLMVVEEDGIEFYESDAQVRSLYAPGPDSITADLAFSGEGARWNEVMTLSLTDDGGLMRSGEALPEPLRYRRCSGSETIVAP